MRVDTTFPVIKLSDYTPFSHEIDKVELTFQLDPARTQVTARISFRPNPAAGSAPRDLYLHGRDLTLITATIDGTAISSAALNIDAEGLRVPAEFVPEGPFVWEAVTEIAPQDNTELEGLYLSNGMYCTQCEAEGFRKITYYPDRPDVMAKFSVRIEGSEPVLLSNGNQIDQGPGWVEWHDPFPKPSYLFALVAGDLVAIEDNFTTMSGREVLLQIWVRAGDEDRCTYAMDALKRAMKWDEQTYGREYDLDRFMIVAVDDFNMGAMENKGLNIFNSTCVLASPDTATDAEYKRIEAIVAHEYFHNWTGNRITCRDWFQLCLKEGLTVFRDQQFSSAMRSPAVKRIEDVLTLRARQYREDAGGLAHPVRPESYIEINNFYTATVYEKGAELVGMLQNLVGGESYDKALALYFDRHDGQACTIEDWLKVFEDATGRDLSHFKLWYSQAGTPHVEARENWAEGRYTLTLSQTTHPTPGQPDKAPLVIPVSYGLIGGDGTDMAQGMLTLEAQEQSYEWDLPHKPVASLFRGLSAPVILHASEAMTDRLHQLAHDSDPFNRWEAGHKEALDTILTLAEAPADDINPDYLEAITHVARDAGIDPAYKALLLTLPSVEELVAHIAEQGGAADPVQLHAARHRLNQNMAKTLEEWCLAAYHDMAIKGPYTPDAAAAGKRSLRARALGLLTLLEDDRATARAQFQKADNMTETMSALSVLVQFGAADAELDAFKRRWHSDRLVMNKWFSVQASASPPEHALGVVEALARDEAFDFTNPNRFRALIGAFGLQNLAGFHADGTQSYDFVMDWLLKLDAINPQITARLTSIFENWRSFDTGRQDQMRAALDRMADHNGLSRNTREMVNRILGRDKS